MARKSKQIPFSYDNHVLKRKLMFGGGLLKNSHAKEKRPLCGKSPIHIVLRSSLAYGSRSMLRSKRHNLISDIVSSNAKKLGIKLQELVNVGNHLHIVVYLNTGNETQTRVVFGRFIRAITGLIARSVLGIKRGSRVGLKFWDQRPFTRIIESWTGLKILKKYIEKNVFEAWGMLPGEIEHVPREVFEGIPSGFE